MFGVGRHKSLRRKGRFLGLSLRDAFFALGRIGRLEVSNAQRLQDPPRVRTSSTDTSSFGLIVKSDGHCPERGERLHRPFGREIKARLLEPAVQKSLNQQSQCSYENICLYSLLA